MVYADFESILIQKNNGKQNSDESCTNKYQNHVVAFLFINQYSKLFKSNLGRDDVHSFITNMVGKSKFCSSVMKNHFYKELVMTKEDNKNVENPTRVGFVIILSVKIMLK